MTDDEIEALAKKHIAPHADRLAGIRTDWPPYQQTEQFRRVKALVVDVLSKLRAPEAGERITWIADYEPLYYFAQHHKVDYNALCTAARAALASAPVAGEATYYAVMHGQAIFGIFETETAAGDCIAKALYPKVMSIRPLYAAPQASEAVREMRAMLESWQAIADRIVEQYGGVVAGVDFGAIGRANRAALSAQPDAQKTKP